MIRLKAYAGITTACISSRERMEIDAYPTTNIPTTSRPEMVSISTGY